MHVMFCNQPLGIQQHQGCIDPPKAGRGYATPIYRACKDGKMLAITKKTLAFSVVALGLPDAAIQISF